MCRRSLLAKEGEDSELAEENFWEEMDKMCRQEKICRKCEKFLDNDMDMNMFCIFFSMPIMSIMLFLQECCVNIFQLYIFRIRGMV